MPRLLLQYLSSSAADDYQQRDVKAQERIKLTLLMYCTTRALSRHIRHGIDATDRNNLIVRNRFWQSHGKYQGKLLERERRYGSTISHFPRLNRRSFIASRSGSILS